MSIYIFRQKAKFGHHTPMGSSGGGGGSQTTTQELPGYAQPAAQDILSRGTALSNQEIPQYQGKIFEGLNGTQTDAIRAAGNLAQSGGVGGQVSGAVANMANNGGNNYGTVQAQQAQAGYNQFADTNNPYLQAQVQAANDQTARSFNQNAMSLNASFANNYGGSAHQNAINDANATLGTTLANNAATMYGNAYNTAAQAANTNATLSTQASLANQSAGLQAANLNSNNYNTAQQRVLAAAGLAPQLDANTINQQVNAYTLGTAQQTADQNALNAEYQKWYQGAMSPYQQLGILQGTLSGALGNGAQGITSTTQQANPWGLAIGGATAGAGLLSAMSSLG